METNRRGIDFIKGFESLQLKPYLDQANIWTIGYGHTSGVTQKTSTITVEQADYFLKKDLGNAEAGVNKYVTISLSQNEFNALVSFTYNAGIGKLLSSTLIRKLNCGDKQGTAREFGRWVYYRDPSSGNMVVSNGLARRRKAEAELFLSDFVEKRASVA